MNTDGSLLFYIGACSFSLLSGDVSNISNTCLSIVYNAQDIPGIFPVNGQSHII